MEASSTCETLVNFYQTTLRNNPEGSHLEKKIGNITLSNFLRNDGRNIQTKETFISK
jgi:hypothetical protein